MRFVDYLKEILGSELDSFVGFYINDARVLCILKNKYR